MARVICEVGPQFVFVENSPVLTSRGLGVVLGDLAEMGYDAQWCVLGTKDAGGQCIGDRIWILATPNKVRRIQGREIPQKTRAHIEVEFWERDPRTDISNADTAWLLANGYIGRVDSGLGSRVDQLAAIGNGQDPRLAALAWRILSQ